MNPVSIIHRRLILFLIAYIFNVTLSAQGAIDLQSEQIFLTSDRNSYAKTDTIAVKGILTSLGTDSSLPISRIIYLELISSRTDSVMIRHKIACRPDGLFSDSIATQSDWRNGDYFLRAYTRFMLNFDMETLPLQYIKIGGPIPANDELLNNDIQCSVSVPGGALLAGIPQRIIAALTNHLGYQVAGIPVILTDSYGKELSTQLTSASGFASFNFVPEKNMKYSLKVDVPGVCKSFDVPSCSPDGCRVDMVLKKDRLRFMLSGNVPEQRHIYLYNYCNGLSELPVTSNSGSVLLNGEPQGPVTMFLTDGDLNVIAETSAFIYPDTLPQLSTADIFIPDEEITFGIDGVHSENSTMLERVIPFDESIYPTAFNSLQLSNDFTSLFPLPVPSNSAKRFFSDVDLWLGASKFNRFNLDNVTEGDSSVYRIKPERFIRFSGTVYDDSKARHPMNKGKITAINGSNWATSEAAIDKNGRFTIEVEDFIQGSEFFLNATNSKGVMKKSIIKIEDAIYPAVGHLPQPLIKNNVHLISSDSTITDSYELPDVKIKARYERKKERTDKSYYGARLIDRELIQERPYYRTLIDLLRDLKFVRVVQIADFNVDPNANRSHLAEDYNPIYVVKTTRLPSNLGASAGILPIYIDGVSMDYKAGQYMFDIPVDQIESVEQLSANESLIYTAKALYGVIAVTTRKLGAPAHKDTKGTRCWPDGLTSTSMPVNKTLKAPRLPGKYRLVVDVVTHDGKVNTLIKNITVVHPEKQTGK